MVVLHHDTSGRHWHCQDRVSHRRRQKGTNFFVLWIFPRRWWVAVCAERRFIVKRFYVFYDFYEIIISRFSSLLVVLVKSVCVRVLAEMLLSGDAVFLNAAPTPRDTSIWIWPSSRVKGWTQFERVFLKKVSLIISNLDFLLTGNLPINT